VHIFDPSMPMSTIQSVITSVYDAQQNNHFGDRRDALVFKPGTYNVDVGVGFYTEVLGLGATPDAVNITGNRTPTLPIGQQFHPELLARRHELLGDARQRHRQVGRLAGDMVPSDARPRQHRAAPEWRLGERRLHVQHAG
jgi:hypothetical protein